MHRTAPRAAQSGEWPAWLDERLVGALRARGFERPYRHQVEALNRLHAGQDVVLATATASGKSLCYQLPILQRALDNSGSRALLLFPTKALARDQVESMRGLVRACSAEIPELGTGPGAATFDGDTPPDERRAARARATAVATNPDMLHRSILPRHDLWGPFLAGLDLVVIDELHAYRGVFGSHVGLVMRRLWRLCAHYGSRPRIVSCSATIQNPDELARLVTGRAAVHAITEADNGSPKGPRTMLMLNPGVVDETTGVRRDYLKVARGVTTRLREAQVSTLAFCRTRRAVELLTRYLREDEAGIGEPSRPAARGAPARGPVSPDAWSRAVKRIRGYRGGYLPERRRDVERALREGEAQVVAATNALELGIDVGGLDAVVLAGYPGTRAATWQRIGRSGRRGTPSLAVLILSSSPLDQFVAGSPWFLLDEPPEQARIDPTNPELLVAHLRCAAFELPLEAGEPLGWLGGEVDPARRPPGSVDQDEHAELLDYLAERGVLRREELNGRVLYFSIGSTFPADEVDIRGPLEENFQVVEQRPGHAEDGKILAEVDFPDGPLYLHPGAIYPLEGRTYEVRQLDWDERKAYVRSVEADYYTEAVTNLQVRLLEGHEGPGQPDHERPASDTHWGTGLAHLVRKVPAFKKLRFRTHENIGFGPIDLPDLELHTQAAWWTFTDAMMARLADPQRRAEAAMAAGHAIHHVAAMLLMCDVGDLGHAVGAEDGGWALTGRSAPEKKAFVAAGRPTLYLYDDLSGGAGLSHRVSQSREVFFDRVIAMTQGCRCHAGCPTCMGADAVRDPDRIADRDDLLVVLRGLRDLVSGDRSGVGAGEVSA